MVRDDVLRTLEEHRGEQISGGTLARKLGVSRTAIWKAVSSLREMGFPITSAAGGGYCLDESSDALSEAGISMNLTTRYAAQHLCVLSTVDSTNNYLKQHAADLPHGYAVVADCQTAGRGRLGRSFVSPSGSGIYISLLLRPNIPLERMHLMTVGAAIAACEAIQETAGFTPDIKWVNDVYVAGKKICGILTEAVSDLESGSVEFLVVGIGINLTCEAFPPELREIATALSEHGGERTDCAELIAAVLCELEQVYDQLDTAAFMPEYRQRSCVIGKWVRAIRAGAEREVLIKDIDDNGALLVENQAGVPERINSGEISLRFL